MNIDSWQKGYAELSRQLANLKKENLAMSDELIKLRRTYEDQINNLTFDNMPTVKKITLQSEDGVVGLTIKLNETNAQVLTLAEIQTEQGKNIAAVDAKADEAKAEVNIATQTATEASNAVTLLSVQTNANGARITSLAETQTEQGKSIAKVSQDTAENAVSIKSLASVQTEQGQSIAAITQTTNELGAEVNIAVESASAANENVSNGAYLIARVNEDESNIKIKADKVEIEGVVTFSDLEEEGKTTINGANIMTGTVVADRIALNENGQIDFTNLGHLYFIEESTGAQGEIYLKPNEYDQGEILINTDGTIDLAAGSANIGLHTDTHNHAGVGITGDDLLLYIQSLSVNGSVGLSGTFSLGNGSITVVNGIVVGISGGSDGPEIVLEAPSVEMPEGEGYFSIYNPNEVGHIAYYSYWYDDYGNSGQSEVRKNSGNSFMDYVFEYPPSGGTIGVTAWIEYDGRTSDSVSAETWFA